MKICQDSLSSDFSLSFFNQEILQVISLDEFFAQMKSPVFSSVFQVSGCQVIYLMILLTIFFKWFFTGQHLMQEKL